MLTCPTTYDPISMVIPHPKSSLQGIKVCSTKKTPKLCQEAVASTRFVFMSDNLGISWFSFVSLTKALGINRHILRWWARGLQSPPICTVFRFHYHSQKVRGYLGKVNMFQTLFNIPGPKIKLHQTISPRNIDQSIKLFAPGPHKMGPEPILINGVKMDPCKWPAING